MLAIAVAALLSAAFIGSNYTPGEAIRYAEKRLAGHPKLERVFLPSLAAARERVERQVAGPLPSLNKGQWDRALPAQRYDSRGAPVPLNPRHATRPETSVHPAASTAATVEQFAAAIARASPGHTIEIAPGTYDLRQTLSFNRGGVAGLPIILRAATPGTVTLRTHTVEALRIAAPYWLIENLVIKGVCDNDSTCEHAFHVVGAATGVVIRNNRIEDFNSHIKVNGEMGAWPDHGLIQFNTISNSRPRATGRPVTLIDLVGASHWRVHDNLVSNFVKRESNGISYGIFMKGAGSHGSIERNLIVCTPDNISQFGARVGISLGGGGTGAEFCRDRRCITEHSSGIIFGNIVAHCNDFGIYINSANQTRIEHNLLINNFGIDVRFATASASLKANLLDGTIRARDGALISEVDNHSDSMKQFFASPDTLDLSWRAKPRPLGEAVQSVDHLDFCGNPFPPKALPGPIQSDASCTRRE